MLILVPAGCAPAPAPAPAPAADRAYPLRGVVVEVDPGGGRLTVRHEAIPGFMPAMTMPLPAADPAELEDVRPGDTITATLRVGPSGSRLAEVAVTGLAPEPPPAPAPAAAVLRPGDPVPDALLTGQDGRPLALSDLRGDVVVLTFIYTRCPLPEFCPRQDAKFADLARRLALVPERASRVRLLSISFDAAHDTPEVLRRHAALRGAAAPLWTFAVAGPDAMAAIGPPLGLAYGPDGSGEFVHGLSTAVIGPDGRLVRLERGGAWSVDALFPVVARAAGRPAGR
jgi:protein SCO1/2